MKTDFRAYSNALRVALPFLVLAIFMAPAIAQAQVGPGNQQQNTAGQRQNQSGQSNPAVRQQPQQNTQTPRQNQQAPGTRANPASSTQVVQPVRPFPELDQQHQAFVDQLLSVWQQRSAQIKRYEFNFERWIYMPQYCKWRDPVNKRLAACTLARGKVRYKSPGKGMYEVSIAWRFNGVKPATDANGQPLKNAQGQIIQKADYEEIKDANDKREQERWICDGNSIFEYDFEKKRIYETKLPPELRGQGLKHSPLPFLFGVDVKEMKERYWIRALPSKDEKAFTLEAYPKRIDDARNYKKIVLVLSRDPYLPAMLEMYHSNYDEKTNQSYTVFKFDQRKVDGKLSVALDWAGHFVKPRLPDGGLQWKMIERKPLANDKFNQANRPTDLNRKK